MSMQNISNHYVVILNNSKTKLISKKNIGTMSSGSGQQHEDNCAQYANFFITDLFILLLFNYFKAY